MNNLPEWMKTTLFFLFLSILWDCVRTVVQVIWTSHLTKKLVRKDLTEIKQAVENVEEAIDDVEEAIDNDTKN